jgi:predicted CXXCH cytochrome family protein
MRRQHLTQLIGTLVVATALIGLPTVAFADVENSVHNLSWLIGGADPEICIVCHTPHFSDTTASSPLWNHEVTDATFDLYTSDTLDAVVGQPDGISKLCLSCHDGTVAIDNYGGETAGTVFMDDLNPDYNLTTDLSDDHPVSFAYNTALAGTDGGLYDPSTQNTPAPLGGTIDEDLLFGTNLECASCHDVHDEFGNTSLLVIPNNGSALCLTCHIK